MKCVDKNGYLYSTSISTLKSERNNLTNKFSRTNPYCLHNMNLYLKNNNINNIKIVSLSDESNGVQKYVNIECSCGVVYQKIFTRLINNRHFCCDECLKRERLKKKVELDKVINEFSKYNLKMLSEYKRSTLKVNVEDNKTGYKGSISYNQLTNVENGKFKIFDHRNPFAIYNINLYLEKQYINCKCVEKDYSKPEQKLEFECECGNHYFCTIDCLKDGQVRCSECSKSKSKLEYIIETWLKQNNIEYKTQYKFDDCRNIKPLPFDFYIQGYGLIEVDGEQHFKPSSFQNRFNKEKSQQNLLDIQFRDNIKNKYCENNNIKLLRISYKDIFRNDNYKRILEKELLNKTS